ncbi:MAG: type II secretion system protein GspG [Planctomycetes bacterium]|nr:type II secretion system protein GspG [Planctomycetota bacterium]
MFRGGRARSGRGAAGVTLIELIFVIVIIGILATIVVSKYSSNLPKAKIAATKQNLQELRTALELYFAENGAYPTASTLVELTSDANSKVFIRKIPQERITPSTAIANSLTGAGGWYYNSSTNAVQPNLSGNDAEGDAYSGY